MSRSLTAVYLLIISLLFSHCDPERNIGGTFHFKIKGTLNNTTETIFLGDTLKFEVKIPSSITATTIEGTTRTEAVNSLQTAFYGFDIFRVDTIHRTVYTNDSTKIEYIISPGYQTNSCSTCFAGFAYLQKTAPYSCVLNLIPQVKGIFYFQIIPQEGNFVVNNNFEGLFAVNINVTDKHLSLITPYLTTGWQQAMEQRDINGFGVYCFRVN